MRDNALELEKKEQPVLEVKKQEEEKTDPEPGMSLRKRGQSSNRSCGTYRGRRDMEVK